tara:strand:- start:31107 stop:32021 length:915 start_codon:yes stop_codon:yes gene_type:complete
MSSVPRIRWSASTKLSEIHAARTVAMGRSLTDRKTEQALVAPATEVNQRLLSASIDVTTFWQRLFDETAFDAENPRACEIALVAAGCSELQAEQTGKAIGSRLGECRIAFHRRYPKLAQQLALRSQPLCQRWDMIGHGMLSGITKRIWGGAAPNDWWPSRIEGLMVQPIRGGDGGYDPDANQFWMEAMLTDVDPAVPEILRVAWLVTRVATEQHTRDRLSAEPSSLPWGIGSVPFVLSTAAELDVIPDGPLPISRAVELWHLGDATVGQATQRWWQHWQESPTPLPVALTKLGQQLRAIANASS